MRSIAFLVLSVLATVISVQLYNLYREQSALKKELLQITEETEKLERENLDLRADIEYFGDPRNLAKELKSKFNYKNPGEKLIIVVPENE